MKIESLQVQNFRCFENLWINFDRQLTVLVGVNGTGKTSVVDALAIYLEFITHNLQYDNMTSYNFPHITKTSISSHSKDGTVCFTIKLYDKNDNIQFIFTERKIDSSRTIPGNDLNALAAIQEINELRNREFTPILPILACYSATRTLKKDLYANNINYDAETGLESVFARSFETYIDYVSSIEWFSKKDADEARNMRDGIKNYKIPELYAVREAILKALPEYEKIGIRNDELILFEKKTQMPFTLKQLSDGYRTMLALVMDLARRMAVANGEVFAEQEKSILESPAIVLIDEVELHLHPSWQQTVLPSLMQIFPNTQFIVTTHSPQVISSIEPKHIRILKDGKMLPVETSTYGAESSRVLEEVFGVPVRPFNEVKKALDEYLKLINDRQGQSDRARDLRVRLDNWLAEDPILEKADMFIARNARRKEREESSHA